MNANNSHDIVKKVADVTVLFWIMKISATTLGETAGDMLSMTFNWGYGLSSLVLLGFFVLTFLMQLFAKKYNPILYWLVIISTSTAGTTISDFMDRTLGLGYLTGSLILFSTLIMMLSVWYFSEKSLSVTNVHSRKVEVFYWLTILVSNTLGTALGDFLADDSGLGFSGGALLIGSLLLILVGLFFFTKISRVLLFWIAFVLTRPFGATFGDLLTKSVDKGGLNLGTIGSSLVLGSVLMILIGNEWFKERRKFNTENK
ncbi:membrane protein [Flavobacterium antarcticum]|uniref:COG4705 family protein n=1 Tax=Flavobacterium antarcticum TaxID=271155 RepID=UPI0003B79C51|nr:membrane protein [Flavobacterium antarcticum]